MSDESPSSSFRAELFVRHPRSMLLGAASVLFLFTMLVVMSTQEASLPMGLLASIFIPSAIAWVVWLRTMPKARELEVEASPAGLRVGDAVIPRGSIQDAQIVPTPSPVVRVSRRGRMPLDLCVSSVDEGRTLLRALGFDVSQTVTRFVTGSVLLRTWPLRFAFPIATLLGALLTYAVLPGLTAVLVFLFCAVYFFPARTHVGADGVLVTWLGIRRFYPVSSIRSVDPYTVGRGRNRVSGARLTMVDGSQVDIPVGRSRRLSPRAAALLERIQEARDTAQRGVNEASAILLERGGRGVAEWLRALQAVGAGAIADLRSAPISHERLWRVVESHGAPAEERAAAAVALSSSLDASGKQRLRVAAEAVADRRLRVALDAAENGDEAAMQEALGEVSPPLQAPSP